MKNSEEQQKNRSNNIKIETAEPKSTRKQAKTRKEQKKKGRRRECS